jgi:prevent-host-death family protein
MGRRLLQDCRDCQDFRIFLTKGDCAMSTTVAAAEVSKNFDAYQDAAMRAPVIITKNGRPGAVLLAYEDFVRLSARDRRVERAVDLSDADIAAIEASEMAPGFDPLNAELEPNRAAD